MFRRKNKIFGGVFMKLKVKCPKCSWIKNMIIYKELPKGKRTKCFKCEEVFVIHHNVQDTTILKRLK